MLLPLPGESVESSALELGATSKTVGSSMAQLLTAANQGKGRGWGEGRMEGVREGDRIKGGARREWGRNKEGVKS